MNKLTRWIRHWWLDVDDACRLLTKDGLQRLAQRVRESETRHRGELRVCVQSSLSASQLWRGTTAQQCAVELFSQLRVWDTEHNNGVLIYLLLADHRIEILADRGLSRHTSPAQWEALVNHLSQSLREGRYEAGLAQAIAEVDALMCEFFPASSSHPDSNELPDGVLVM